MVDLKAEITIDAPPDQVWRIVASDFGDIAHWATGIYASRMISGGDRIGRGSARSCDTMMGTIEETLIEFDDDQRRLAYEGRGMPFFIRQAVNRWSVDAAGQTTSVLRIHATLVLIPVIGTIIWAMSAPRMRRLRMHVPEELKHLVETGEIHPRKINERRRRGKSRAGAAV